MSHRYRIARILEIAAVSVGAVLTLNGLWKWWVYLNSAQYPGSAGGFLSPPGIFLIEPALLSILLVPLAVMDSRKESRAGSILAFCAGALTMISMLGVWSIGPSVMPAAGAALLAVALATVRLQRSPAPIFAWLAAGAVAHLALALLGMLGSGTR